MRKTKTGHQWANRWHPEKSKFPVEKVRALYQQGLSYRQIEAETGWSNTLIARACKDIARSQRDAAILRQPPTSNHWRSARATARKNMEHYLGRKLESWEHVHHKDADYTNNDISNLEILTASDHAKHHHPKKLGPRTKCKDARLDTPERRAWKRKWHLEKRLVNSTCAWCKKPCKADKYKLRDGQEQHCSHSCAAKTFWRKKKCL